MGLHGGINIYSYVRSKPVRQVDPFGLFAIDDSCNGCDFNENFKKEIAWACDVFAMAMSPNNRYANCLARRCKSGKIKCDTSPENCDGSTLAWALHGWGKTANLCIQKIKNYEPRFIGAVVIHEWAHTCGWDHGDDANPQWDPDGYDGIPGGGDGRMRDPWY